MESPKYLIVQEWIKSEINKGTYTNGDKIPSENELMERFGFSRQTIRLAISHLENMGYLEKIKGSGTYVNVRSTNNVPIDMKNIGVILRHLDYYIYPEIITGIERTLMQNGYTMTLSITHDKVDTEISALNSLMEKKPDGIIAEPCKTAMPMPVRDMYRNIASKTPLLFINGGYFGVDIPVVEMDYVKAAEKAANYLIEMGHRSIGAILKSDDIDGHKKYEGFSRILIENKLPVNDKNVLWFTSDMSHEVFTAMFKQAYFSGLNQATALLCHDDKTTEEIISILKDINVKLFDDISIISFDNSQTAEILGLTSMTHGKAELGAKAAELIIKQIKTGDKISGVINSELVTRNSVHKRSFSSSWDTGSDLYEIFE